MKLAVAAPERFAALVPVAGGGDVTEAERLVNVPIWAFHGGLDEVVPPAGSRKMTEAVQRARGNARLTIYEDRGHNVCDLTFAREDVYEWLLAQRREGD